MRKGTLWDVCRWTVLVFAFVALSWVFSFVREQVHGQNQYPYGTATNSAAANVLPPVPQVVIQQQAAPPKVVVMSTPIDLGGRRINVVTTVDTEMKRITVHHVDVVQGTIKWMSTRNIQQDILVDEFNAVKPTPHEIDESIRYLNK
ncbi:MAG: hypothetical protein FWE67_12005 [Planctomycetaceae bacterium]|nr:hypothetical protein [Planctomycetaceae bacterium]